MTDGMQQVHTNRVVIAFGGYCGRPLRRRLFVKKSLTGLVEQLPEIFSGIYGLVSYTVFYGQHYGVRFSRSAERVVEVVVDGAVRSIVFKHYPFAVYGR